MANNATFYRDRATLERQNAADSTLENVRVRCERAAASWDAMAVRAERVERDRANVRSAAE
ncbi:hypothetical protein [Sphingomonas sp.]|uniref:hypothetical protein n=1 Tax=Sphingomonas sp. TaxID=28214 RepID=UPI002C7E3733|nr:hypothetical protein [Sphingomonas sp.]HTG38975.1 hypothetical protein [Sphingomonas sp.]